MTQSKKIYAVTGGIGSGKTAVSGIIAEEGYPVFSCDKIYGELTAGGELVDELERAFGNVTLPDGSLDRGALAAKVFCDKSALERLNGITHPIIMRELLARARSAEEKLVFCEVPLLFEGGYAQFFNGVIVVLRLLGQRIAAVTARSNLTPEEVTARIRAQFDYDRADLSAYITLHNDGNMDDLRKKVKKIIRSIAN